MRIVPKHETVLAAPLDDDQNVVLLADSGPIEKYDPLMIGEENCWVAKTFPLTVVRGQAHPETGVYTMEPHPEGERAYTYSCEYTPEEWAVVWPYMVSPEDPLARAIIRAREAGDER